ERAQTYSLPSADLERAERALGKEIARREKQRLEHARNLEFEKAAAARDQLARLKAQVFGAGQ
ncbi:MAG: UvrB/UvrC motif-containing protein, partial [Burkholderiaceae bacterium]